MKAFRIYGAYRARYEELADPEIGPDEVLVRVRATAVCGTDLEIYQGTMVYFCNGMAHYPIIPGHEWSGEVLEVGRDVSDFRVGDKVVGECTVSCGYCEFCRMGWYNQCANRRETGILNLDGGFADKLRFPAAFLHKFERLSFEEACMCETTAISVYAVSSVQIGPRDQVAVLGAGPIGLQALQAAKAHGARKVVVIGGRPSRQQLALQLGADAVIDPRQQDLVQETLKLTGGRKFDAVVECTGNPVVTQDMLRIVRPCGRVVMVGLFNNRAGEIDLDALVVNNVRIQGSLGSPNVWDETLYLMENGKVQTRPLISVQLPLAQALDVFKMMEERRPDLIKAVLLP